MERGRKTNKIGKGDVKETERGESDRVMEETLLKIMNVNLSFLLYDPGAFANYPDSQRSVPSLLPAGEELRPNAKHYPCYRIHQADPQGQWAQTEIEPFFFFFRYRDTASARLKEQISRKLWKWLVNVMVTPLQSAADWKKDKLSSSLPQIMWKFL